MDNSAPTLQATLDFIAARDAAFNLEFRDVITWVSEVLDVQSTIGFTEPEMSLLAEADRDCVVTYVGMMNSMDTTLVGMIRLLAAGCVSDACALLRIIWETWAVMSFGTAGTHPRRRVVRILGRGTPRKGGRTQEVRLSRDAQQRLMELNSADPHLPDLLDHLNNFGAHISRNKIFAGNMRVEDGGVVATPFSLQFNDEFLLRALSTVCVVFLSANIDYERMMAMVRTGGSPPTSEFDELKRKFLTTVQPALLARRAHPTPLQ